MTKKDPEGGPSPASFVHTAGATQAEDPDYWSQFIRRVFRSENFDGSEAALWIAVARYAERPSKGRERELRRAAREFGVSSASLED